MKKIIIALIAVAVIAIGAFFGYEHLENKKYLASPNYALAQIEKSIESQNYKLFKHHVDVAILTDDLLGQILSDTESKENKDSLMGRLSQVMGSALTKKYTEYIQPELKRGLAEQLQAFVSTRSFTSNAAMKNLYSDKPLLEKVWRDFSGDSVTFKGFKNIETLSENSAKATAEFYREDLNHTINLNLSLGKENSVWTLERIANLDTSLAQIEKIKQQKINAENALIQQKIAENIQLIKANKSAGVSQWGIGKGVLLALAFENVGTETISAFNATVAFKKGEKTLREVSINNTDAISQGDVLEKSWPMAINPLSKSDNEIFENPNITMAVEVTSVTFETGKKLQKIK